MYDPETTFEPLIVEIEETIIKMRKVKQIDDKLKHSEHVKNLSETFANFMNSLSAMMETGAMADFDDDDDLF